MKICEKQRHKIDSIVYNKIVNIGLKRNAEDLFKMIKTYFYNFKFDSTRYLY